MQVAEQAPFQSRLVKFGAHAVHVGLELVQFAALDLGEERLDHRFEARAGFRQVDDLAVASVEGVFSLIQRTRCDFPVPDWPMTGMSRIPLAVGRVRKSRRTSSSSTGDAGVIRVPTVGGTAVDPQRSVRGEEDRRPTG